MHALTVVILTIPVMIAAVVVAIVPLWWALRREAALHALAVIDGAAVEPWIDELVAA